MENVTVTAASLHSSQGLGYTKVRMAFVDWSFLVLTANNNCQHDIIISIIHASCMLAQLSKIYFFLFANPSHRLFEVH